MENSVCVWPEKNHEQMRTEEQKHKMKPIQINYMDTWDHSNIISYKTFNV